MIKAVNVNGAASAVPVEDEEARADIEALQTAVEGKADKDASYTKAEDDAMLAEKADIDDIPTDFYTKEETDEKLGDKADADTVYTKTETDTLLSAKADTTAIPTALSQLSEDETHKVVTAAEKTEWNNKSDFSGDYEDLTNKPTIPTVPTVVSAFTNDAGYLTEQSLSGYAKESWVEGKGYLVASDISGKQDKATQITSGTEITLADNTEYRLTDVTELTITYPDGNFEVWMRIAVASSGTVNISFPTSTHIGNAPTFTNGEVWELSIKDKCMIASKVRE